MQRQRFADCKVKAYFLAAQYFAALGVLIIASSICGIAALGFGGHLVLAASMALALAGCLWISLCYVRKLSKSAFFAILMMCGLLPIIVLDIFAYSGVIGLAKDIALFSSEYWKRFFTFGFLGASGMVIVGLVTLLFDRYFKQV